MCKFRVADNLVGVCSRRFVGGSRMYHPNWCAIEKSSRLNGSAMLACVGTLWRICRILALLCHVQCDPSRLFKGVWDPDPLIIACVAASLSQSCMYVGVNKGLTRTGVIMAAQASRK